MTRPERFSKSMSEAWSFVRQYSSEEQIRRENAVNTIQRAWRRWLDIGVFEYYKDLIGFKECGEPSRLMRYIEPREAQFLDAAAGVHIRFRLGGVKFPPCIYYKVFTHRPIVDLCANSPKDYAKLKTLKEQRGKSQGDNKDLSGWYQRIENNGWRLLSPRFWKALDSITAEDNTKVKEFHYSKVQRKQDVEKRRKRKKVEWLKQMYYGEHLQVRTLDPNETSLIQRAAQGLFSCLKSKGQDSVMEWEVDEMLQWTNALNYDEYIKQWNILGTSKFSEDFSGFWFTEPYKCSELSDIQAVIQKEDPPQQKPDPPQLTDSLMNKPSIRRSVLSD